MAVLGSSASPSGEVADSVAPSPAPGSLRGAVAAFSETGIAEVATAVASEPGCRDDNAQCSTWASSGECERNPGYMLYWCRASCAVDGCDTTPAPMPTSPPATTETPPALDVAIPGLADCLQHGFTINTCYQNEGFVDGDCKCVPGQYEGKYTWYMWICNTKHGQPYPTRFCSSDCIGDGCHA